MKNILILLFTSILFTNASVYADEQLELFPGFFDQEQAGDFISDLAYDIGEYFRPDEEQKKYLTGITFEKLPKRIRDAAQLELESRSEMISDYCYEGREDGEEACATVEFADDFVYEIRNERGTLVGYVVFIWDIIDHPLFDGAGVDLYMDLRGELVEQIEWNG